MTLSDRVSIAGEVMVKQLDGELVLLDLARGMYFGLNATGMRIWELVGVAGGATLADVCDVLLAELDVERDVVEADVLRVCEELAAHGLVELAPR